MIEWLDENEFQKLGNKKRDSMENLQHLRFSEQIDYQQDSNTGRRLDKPSKIKQVVTEFYKIYHWDLLLPQMKVELLVE